MMDVSQLGYLLAFVLIVVPVFLVARAVRQFGWDSEAQQRATLIHRVDGAVDRYAESDAYDDYLRRTYGNTGADSDSNGNSGTLGAVNRDPRRRAIRRPDVGPRAGRHALSRDLGFADAAPVGGYDRDRR